MWEDPIVKEIREIGAKLAEQSEYDIQKFGEMIRKHQKESGEIFITKEDIETTNISKLRQTA